MPWKWIMVNILIYIYLVCASARKHCGRRTDHWQSNKAELSFSRKTHPCLMQLIKKPAWDILTCIYCRLLRQMPTHPAKLNYHGNIRLDDQHRREKRELHSETVRRESISHLIIFIPDKTDRFHSHVSLWWSIMYSGIQKSGKCGCFVFFYVNVPCNSFQQKVKGATGIKVVSLLS